VPEVADVEAGDAPVRSISFIGSNFGFERTVA
jgi:hypothetical protein